MTPAELYTRHQYDRDQAADDNREAKIDAAHGTYLQSLGRTVRGGDSAEEQSHREELRQLIEAQDKEPTQIDADQPCTKLGMENKAAREAYEAQNAAESRNQPAFDRQRWLDSLKIGDKVDAYVEHTDYYNGVKTLIAPPQPYDVPEGVKDKDGYFWAKNEEGGTFCINAEWLRPVDYTQEQVFAELPAVTAADFPIGKPRVSSHDFTDFGLEQTYHKYNNTIEHAPDGYAHGDDCQYKIIETWYADEFEKATLYVLGYDRWYDIFQTTNLEAIHIMLVNIWTHDPRFSKRHYKQHPEAAEQAEADSLIPVEIPF